MTKSRKLPGALVLVVGPSGSGKDSLMRLACQKLADDPFYLFVTRYITREFAAEEDAEKHEPLSRELFAMLRDYRFFSLSWEVHGLFYGIPRAVENHLSEGRCVIANVSRTVIADARARFENVHVVNVTASPEVLAARLAARGRESTVEITHRLKRRIDFDGDGVTTIWNEGALGVAAENFLAVLHRFKSVAVF